MSGTLTDSFTAVLQLPASPDTVSALFTSAAGVSRWWGPTTGDAAVGGTLITSFGEHGVNAMRVLESGPARTAPGGGYDRPWDRPTWIWLYLSTRSTNRDSGG